jgi:antitoxin component YwqK of YwqJK toxin-antitoxin module
MKLNLNKNAYIVAAILIAFCIIFLKYPWWDDDNVFYKENSKVGMFMRKHVGWRAISKSNKNPLMSIEYFKGDPYELDHIIGNRYPLVEGDYYDNEGRKVSLIRDRSGVMTVYHPTGIPLLFASVKNGRNVGPLVSFYTNGMIRSFTLFSYGPEDERLIDLRFDTNGTLLPEAVNVN